MEKLLHINPILLALIATLFTYFMNLLCSCTVLLFKEVSKKVLDCFLAFGAGIMIAANRYKHIRASRCNTPNQARDDRFHDDANVIALAADDIDIEVAFLCVQAFLESPFDASERRIRRIQKIS